MPASRAHIENAIRKIQERGHVPETHPTQYQLENGRTISTVERVVKDARAVTNTLRTLLTITTTGASSGDVYPDWRAVLLEGRSNQARCRLPQGSLLL